MGWTTTTPPTVIDVTPGDGSRGVAPDVAIIVTFSERMDTTSVERAYSSTDLPPDRVTFSWSDGDTVLSILPDAPLTVATGIDPDQVTAASYQIEITASARDLSGNELPPERVQFSVMREIAQKLPSVRQRNLTGTWRGDGVYGVIDCEEIDTTVCVGDSITAEATYKGFITFDLSALPASGVSVSAARSASTSYRSMTSRFSVWGARGRACVFRRHRTRSVRCAGPIGDRRHGVERRDRGLPRRRRAFRRQRRHRRVSRSQYRVRIPYALGRRRFGRHFHRGLVVVRAHADVSHPLRRPRSGACAPRVVSPIIFAG